MAKKLSDQYENMNNLIIHLKEHGNQSLKDIVYPTNGTKTRKIGVKMSEKINSFLISN